MLADKNTRAFLALLKAGLWEYKADLSQYGDIDFMEVYRLAEEQSVVGLVSEGLEHAIDVDAPIEALLQFMCFTMLIEQRNQEMNHFIGELLGKMQKEGIEAVLIKGQGIAQCYAKPYWRNPGDVDLLLNAENYEKGKVYLNSISHTAPKEYSFNREFITCVDDWCVELHGSLRCGLSLSLNRCVDSIQREICDNHHIRYWDNDGVEVQLPEENDDVMVIFTHFIKHFYKGELVIRQICDWCRLLWTFRETINTDILSNRIQRMKLVSEWKSFAAYSIEYLGMPVEAMPLYSEEEKWKRKAKRIQSFIVKGERLGHKRSGSPTFERSFLINKSRSMFRRIGVLFRYSRIFPWSTFKFIPHVLFTGLWSAVKGE